MLTYRKKLESQKIRRKDFMVADILLGGVSLIRMSVLLRIVKGFQQTLLQLVVSLTTSSRGS